MTKLSQNHLYQQIRRRLVAGLLVVVPIWLTYAALRFIFVSLDGFFAPLAENLLGFPIPGLGFVLLLLFLYFIGMTATNILGRSVVQFWESILERIPLVRSIYQGAKQLIQTISASKTLEGFKRVVLIEYPRRGLFTLAFVTNFVEDKPHGRRFAVVFIPTPPNPISGISIILPESDLMETNLTVEAGIKMIISGGLVTPEQFAFKLKGQDASS